MEPAGDTIKKGGFQGEIFPQKELGKKGKNKGPAIHEIASPGDHALQRGQVNCASGGGSVALFCGKKDFRSCLCIEEEREEGRGKKKSFRGKERERKKKDRFKNFKNGEEQRPL